MRRGKRLVACILTAGLLALSLTGCTTFDNFKEAFINKNPQAGDTIRIGVYEPMSGADKDSGTLEIQGIQLANKLYPEASGKKIELIYADNKSDIDSAETAMADLMKKKPVAVLGSYGSIYSLIANSHLEVAQVPGIAVTNVNPLVTKNHEYYFRVCFVESYQGEALARYVYEELKQKQVGILLPDDDDQAMAMASSFKDKLVELTDSQDTIAVYQKFEAGAEDFSQQLQAIDDSGVKTVFLAGNIADAAKILKQAKQMGIRDVTFLGDSDWATEEFMKDAGEYINGNVAFSTLYTEEETVTGTSQEFLDAYSAEYGDDQSPDAAVALGFDAYLVLLQAIEKAGPGCTGQEVRDALALTKDFQGASGVITFDNVGDPKKSVVINTIVSKKTEPICTIDPKEPEKKSDKNKKEEKKKENENGTEN